MRKQSLLLRKGETDTKIQRRQQAARNAVLECVTQVPNNFDRNKHLFCLLVGYSLQCVLPLPSSSLRFSSFNTPVYILSLVPYTQRVVISLFYTLVNNRAVLSRLRPIICLHTPEEEKFAKDAGSEHRRENVVCARSILHDQDRIAFDHQGRAAHLACASPSPFHHGWGVMGHAKDGSTMFSQWL